MSRKYPNTIPGGTRPRLKNGSVHRVNTPCLRRAAALRSDTVRGFAGVDLTEWDVLNHRNLLTEHSLRVMAEIAGYAEVVFNSLTMTISLPIR